MRITTGMLNETARRAGLPVNNVSLLNYVNNTSNQLSLVNALNKNRAQGTAALQKESYEKLGKISEELTNTTKLFLQTGEKDIFAKAKEEGNTDTICKAIQSTVKQYNSVLDSLKDNPTALNQYYEQLFRDLPADHKETLAAIGITQSKDGRLAVDTNKLKEADLDTLENIWGGKSNLSEKLAFLSDRISDNAYANAKSSTVQYNSTGNIYSSGMNQLNFWG